MLSQLLDVSILAGPTPVLMSIAGAGGLVFLLVRRSSRWWRWTVPALGAGSVLLVLSANFALGIWRPFPDPLPARILWWAGVGVLGLALGAANLAIPVEERRRIRRAAGALVSLLLVVTLAVMKINAFYGYRPTLGSVLGTIAVHESNFAAIARPQAVVASVARLPLERTWRAPKVLPPGGQVSRVAIPGVKSGFPARPAWVYVPPAYLVSPRPLLPVLVLIAGQPGGPQDWLVAGRLVSVLDSFASAHAGLAPLVVVPDATGSAMANPMCLDSKLGRSASYLTDDVPDWIRQHLQVDQDTTHWSIGGFSYGGTCALQLAVAAPRLYPTFLDISGQQEPTLGDHRKTVQAAYGGDEARYQAANPLSTLSHARFASTTAVLAFGADDHEYGPQALRVRDAAAQAGMAVTLMSLPGAHSWVIATAALRAALPVLAERANIIAPPPTGQPAARHSR